MDRRQFLAASTVAVAAVAGCTSSAQEETPEGEIRGAAPEGPAERAIEVSAVGEVEAEPDRATLSVGVEATGESAEAVESELAEKADALRATFDDLGIPDENVESGRFSVRPEYDGDGYQGAHRFEVVVDDVDSVGDVIDAVAADADDIGRVSFGLTDETRAELRDQALEQALENADEEASYIAENRNVAITGTRSVSTRNVDVVPVRADHGYVAEADAADDGGAAPTTEIDSGPVTVTASVDVSYGFEDAD
ncbi:SIMPL domain-containing protein [Halopiger goleimassiliensis]|uniref:SIMPL domain-containing protein n=1 Tax=Halopiger goleimassiliensis TaxID=1293048 RepID=UPI00067819B6|nr:SIMPL domain-containing protein [Halopiger goleimassiliensis]